MIGKIFSLQTLVLLLICSAAIFYAWLRDRSLKEKLGEIYGEFPLGKHKKWSKYWNWFVVGVLLTNGFVLYLMDILSAEPGDTSPGNPMIIPIVILTMNMITRFRPTTIAERGILLGTRVIPWQDIKNVEWDRDVKQQMWSFTMYFSNNTAPVKATIDRESQPQADELFKKFLKTENRREAVLA